MPHTISALYVSHVMADYQSLHETTGLSLTNVITLFLLDIIAFNLFYNERLIFLYAS